jgi:hypothetical protein
MPRPGIADDHRPAVSGDDGRRVRNYAAVDTWLERVLPSETYDDVMPVLYQRSGGER